MTYTVVPVQKKDRKVPHKNIDNVVNEYFT